MPVFSKLGDGAPDERRPMGTPVNGLNAFPGLGSGPFSVYLMPHHRSSVSEWLNAMLADEIVVEIEAKRYVGFP